MPGPEGIEGLRNAQEERANLSEEYERQAERLQNLDQLRAEAREDVHVELNAAARQATLNRLHGTASNSREVQSTASDSKKKTSPDGHENAGHGGGGHGGGFWGFLGFWIISVPKAMIVHLAKNMGTEGSGHAPAKKESKGGSGGHH